MLTGGNFPMVFEGTVLTSCEGARVMVDLGDDNNHGGWGTCQPDPDGHVYDGTALIMHCDESRAPLVPAWADVGCLKHDIIF